jgi:hypothetical protein
MNLVIFVVLVALFVALTPGVLVYLPPKQSKLVTSLTHGVIFAVIWTIIHKPLMHLSRNFHFMEGLETKTDPKKDSKDSAKKH